MDLASRPAEHDSGDDETKDFCDETEKEVTWGAAHNRFVFADFFLVSFRKYSLERFESPTTEAYTNSSCRSWQNQTVAGK